MGHSVIYCDDCGSPVMEGRNDWKCSCGWYFDGMKSNEQKPWYETCSARSWHSNGDLPPVNTECLAQHPDSNLIRKVKIMSYKYGYAWLFDKNDYEHLVWVACDIEFNPIESQEEIEKEKQVEELNEDLDSWVEEDPFTVGDSSTLSEYLYSLGYRKSK